jgi:hypothetical protein
MPIGKDGWTQDVDIQTLFFRLTIDSACEFLFGESVDSQLKEANLLPANKKNSIDFATHFDRSMMHLAKRFRYGDNVSKLMGNTLPISETFADPLPLIFSTGSTTRKSFATTTNS